MIGEPGLSVCRLPGVRFAQNLMREVVYTEAGDTRYRTLHRRAITKVELEESHRAIWYATLLSATRRGRPYLLHLSATARGRR